MADRDARLRRGLDAHAVLRLELPQHGKLFRPEDIAAGNLLSAVESLDAGVTTTVDWSHNLQTVEHAEAALDALQSVPGRFVLAYGNIQAGPWEWSTTPEFRDFVSRRITAGDDMLGFQMAFDVTGDPEFPERAAFEVARDLGAPVTTHAGVWGATATPASGSCYDNGFVTNAPSTCTRRRSTRTRTSGSLPAAGPCRSRRRASRLRPGLSAHLDAALVRHPGRAVDGHQCLVERGHFSAMRSTIGADRAREHFEAHAKGDTVTNCALRADQVVEWATLGGAKALGLDGVVGSLEPARRPTSC